jgi:hypothetical protein
MNMKIKRNNAAFPWRVDDLMTVSQFIGYCKKRGLRITKEKLEEWDKENWLVPASIIMVPIKEEYSKEHGTIYRYESIALQTPTEKYDYFGLTAQNTSDSFTTDLDILVPSTKAFAAWQDYYHDEKKDLLESKDLSELRGAGRIYYSKWQVFIVTKLLLERMYNEAWLQDIREAIEFTYEIDQTWFSILKKNIDKFNKSEYLENKADFRHALSKWLVDNKVKNSDINAFTERYSEEIIKDHLDLFLNSGLEIDPNKNIFYDYRKFIFKGLRKRQGGAALLCEDYYDIAEVLAHALSVARGEITTIEFIQLQNSGRIAERSCVVCEESFEKTKRGGRPQRTCGKTRCKNEYKNKWKKSDRAERKEMRR